MLSSYGMRALVELIPMCHELFMADHFPHRINLYVIFQIDCQCWSTEKERI